MKYALQVSSDPDCAYMSLSVYIGPSKASMRYDLSDLAEIIPRVVQDILKTPNVCSVTVLGNIICLERLDDQHSWTRLAEDVAQRLNRRFSPKELVSRVGLDFFGTNAHGKKTT